MCVCVCVSMYLCMFIYYTQIYMYIHTPASMRCLAWFVVMFNVGGFANALLEEAAISCATPGGCM